MSTLTKAQSARLRKHVRALNALLDEVRETYPDAGWYLDGTANLNLMSGDSHEGPRGTAHPERILDSVRLERAGGGDW